MPASCIQNVVENIKETVGNTAAFRVSFINQVDTRAKNFNSQLQLLSPLAFMLRHAIFYFIYMQISLATRMISFSFGGSHNVGL